MNAELTLPLAFATGLFGALHCLGMCSGIAGGFFVRCGSGIGAVLGYHTTRILVYGVLGMVGALAGQVLVQQGMLGKGQGLVMIIAGLVITGLALSLLGLIPGAGGRPAGQHRAKPQVGEVRLTSARSGPSPWWAILAGAFNGLVPCGLTVSIAIKGAATGSPLQAGLLMVFFGLGTLPTMALVSLTGTVIGRHARGLYATLAGLAVLALGLWTLYEGWVFFDVMRGLSDW